MTGGSQASHHVIIGGSAAGVSAAVAMRENGFCGTITVVDADPLLPYERPPLSKTPDALGALRPIRPEDDYARHRIDLRLGTRVARLDVGRRMVVLADGEEIAADRVLLATGVAARRLDVPGGDLAEMLTLRDAADAERIFAGLARGGPLSIVGGGFIGLETAAVARTEGIDVTVVENAELPLLKALGPEAACLMTRLHQERGVRVITGRTVREVTGTGAVEEVILSDGERLPAAMVIVGCGVVPNDRLARQAAVPCDEGIVVDEYGRTGHPWIWAAGDVTAQIHRNVGRRERIEHWDVALRHGAAVGASMAGRLTTNLELPYFWSDQYELTLQMFGRGREDDRTVLREGSGPERFVAFRLRDGRLTAVAGLAEPKSVRAAKVLVDAAAEIPPEVLADPATDLRALGRGLRLATARHGPL